LNGWTKRNKFLIIILIIIITLTGFLPRGRNPRRHIGSHNVCEQKWGTFSSNIRKIDFSWTQLSKGLRITHQLNNYVLVDWVGGLNGKIFGPRSWCTDRAQQGPCAMTEYQIFSRTAGPNSVNKHFIIWPLRFSFFLSFLFFLAGNKIRYQNVHLCRLFWPKSQDLYISKVVSVCISQSHNPSRAGQLFAALVVPLHMALIQAFSQ